MYFIRISMNISTILQIYKRPDYLKEQLEAINCQSVKSDKIFIVHNEGNVDFEDVNQNIQYFYINPNKKFHARFALGLLAETKYVFFFDDDTIPGSNFFQHAIDLIEKRNCIIVGNGRILYPEHEQWKCPGWGNPTDNEIECDFGGHVWGMKKEHLKYMWYEEPYSYVNCEDMMLSFNSFRFGNIKTYVVSHPLQDKTKWSSLRGGEYGNDSVSFWKSKPWNEHAQERWKIIHKYIKNFVNELTCNEYYTVSLLKLFFY